MMRWAIAGGLAGGVLLWLATPAVGVGWLAWVALVPPAAVAIAFPKEGQTPFRNAGRIAVPLAYVVALELLLVPALPFGLANGQFGELPAPLFIDGSPVVLVAVVLVPLFGLLLWSVRFGQPWFAVALAPIAWAGLDFLRIKLDPGSSWGPLFLTQHDLPTASLAALGGAPAITLAVAGVGYAAAFAVVRRTRTAALALVGVVAAVTAATFAGEHLRGDGGRTVTVAAVQPGEHSAADDVYPFLRFEPGTYELAASDVIEDLTPLTEEAAARGAQVVAWPEAMSYVDPTQVPAAREELIRLARRTGAAIVVPYFIRAERQGEAVVVSPEGDISEPLPKQRPRWFWDEDGGNRVSPRPVEAAGFSIGTLLGVDNEGPSVARRLADAGAEVLVSSTHDWRELSVMQRAYSRITAAATGAPVVRADWRYGSAIIDSDGADAAAPTTAKSRRVVVADVRTRSGSTPYSEIGDVLGWLCATLAIALGLAVPLTQRARRRAPRPEPQPTPPASHPRR
jgi:apolipoprotein N-acyltransferase